MIQLRQPFSGEYPITLDYGAIWEPYYTKSNPHKGIDYGCPMETSILAAADGWVQTVGYEPGGYGNYVVLLHGDGSGTVYAHLSKVNCIKGQPVKKGDLIAYSGSTGNSSGPHLHFEARRDAGKISTVFDPKTVMQSVIDYIPDTQQMPVMQQPPMNPVFVPSQQIYTNPVSYEQKIDGGVCMVVCDAANIRDADTMRICGQLSYGAKIVVSADIVRYNGLPYHKFADDYLLIAEYDSFGTEILRKITD